MAGKVNNLIFLSSNIVPKTLIGIKDDSTDNILCTSYQFVKRYNINSRREINSWITQSWEKFTCGAVINPANDKITCVINKDKIVEWDENILELKDVVVGQSKFKSSIQSIATGKERLYIIYQNGFVEPLDSNLDVKAEKKAFLKSNNVIQSVQVYESEGQVAIVTKNKASELEIHLTHLDSSRHKKHKVFLPDNKCIGFCLFESCTLITLWSSGDLYMCDLSEPFESGFPGRCRGRVPHINPNVSASVVQVARTLIAINTMDATRDGGIVLVWDTKLGVCKLRKELKMYAKDIGCWAVKNGIVLVEGAALAFMPISPVPTTLASIVGTMVNDSSSPKGLSSAFESSDSFIPGCSNALKKYIRDLEFGSLSQELILDTVVTQLSQMNNLSLLLDVAITCPNLPEKCIVILLKAFIEARRSDTIFTSDRMCQNETSECLDDTIVNDETSLSHHDDDDDDTPVTLNDLVDPFDNSVPKVSSPFIGRRQSLINQLLCRPYTRTIMLQKLQSLGFNNSNLLLQHLYYLLAAGKAHLLPPQMTTGHYPSVRGACEWMSLLLDTHYALLVASTHIDTHKHMLHCYSQLANWISNFEELDGVASLLSAIYNKKVLNSAAVNDTYTIENIVFK